MAYYDRLFLGKPTHYNNKFNSILNSMYHILVNRLKIVILHDHHLEMLRSHIQLMRLRVELQRHERPHLPNSLPLRRELISKLPLLDLCQQKDVRSKLRNVCVPLLQSYVDVLRFLVWTTSSCVVSSSYSSP